MENQTRDHLLKLRDIDARLRRLFERHEEYEKELMEFQRRPFLTAQEQQREKEIKFAKLRGKEEMLNIASRLQAA